MTFPKITFLDKHSGIGVPKEQNLITPDNVNEIKHVVNSLSLALDDLSGVISGLGSGGVQEIYFVDDIEFPPSALNNSLYINKLGQAKFYVNGVYLDLSLPVTTDFNNTENVTHSTVATTLAISAFVDSKIPSGVSSFYNDANYITLDDVPKYKAGDMIDITDDNTINVVLPKNNLEISGRYLVCHKTI